MYDNYRGINYLPMCFRAAASNIVMYAVYLIAVSCSGKPGCVLVCLSFPPRDKSIALPYGDDMTHTVAVLHDVI